MKFKKIKLPKNKCSNCYYYELVDWEDTITNGQESYGLCRAVPPVVKRGDGEYQDDYPSVNGSTMSCGFFKSNKKGVKK